MRNIVLLAVLPIFFIGVFEFSYAQSNTTKITTENQIKKTEKDNNSSKKKEEEKKEEEKKANNTKEYKKAKKEGSKNN